MDQKTSKPSFVALQVLTIVASYIGAIILTYSYYFVNFYEDRTKLYVVVALFIALIAGMLVVDRNLKKYYPIWRNHMKMGKLDVVVMVALIALLVLGVYVNMYVLNQETSPYHLVFWFLSLWLTYRYGVVLYFESKYHMSEWDNLDFFIERYPEMDQHIGNIMRMQFSRQYDDEEDSTL